MIYDELHSFLPLPRPLLILSSPPSSSLRALRSRAYQIAKYHHLLQEEPAPIPLFGGQHHPRRDTGNSQATRLAVCAPATRAVRFNKHRQHAPIGLIKKGQHQHVVVWIYAIVNSPPIRSGCLCLIDYLHEVHGTALLLASSKG